MWVHTKESQGKITPEQALEYLKEGNERFVNNLRINRDLLRQVNLTSEGQFPFAAVLSCIDSRTSAELIFDQGLGDIFSIRIAGNIVNSDILGSMEYACAVAKSKIIVALGHTNCGAIISACQNVKMGNITGLLKKIKPAIEKETGDPETGEADYSLFLKRVTVNNVFNTIQQVREQSPILKDMEEKGDIKIVGGLDNVETGVVDFMDETDS